MLGPMGHDFIQIISVSGELRTAQIITAHIIIRKSTIAKIHTPHQSTRCAGEC